ncbi:MAG: outer membrane lipoprotein carrier protein LolA [Polyangiales bacterium]
MAITVLGAEARAQALTAPEIVARVEATYARVTEFEADVRVFETDAQSNVTTERAGRAQLGRGGAMRIEFTSPRGQLIVSDGATLWSYSAAQRRAVMAKLDESPFAALAVFSGSLSTAFTARLVPMRVAAYQRLHAVELVSRAAQVGYARVFLFVDPTQFRVVELGIIDAQGSRTRIQFDPATLRFNKGAPRTVFQWAPSSQTTVVRAAPAVARTAAGSAGRPGTAGSAPSSGAGGVRVAPHRRSFDPR